MILEFTVGLFQIALVQRRSNGLCSVQGSPEVRESLAVATDGSHLYFQHIHNIISEIDKVEHLTHSNDYGSILTISYHITEDARLRNIVCKYRKSAPRFLFETEKGFQGRTTEALHKDPHPPKPCYATALPDISSPILQLIICLTNI